MSKFSLPRLAVLGTAAGLVIACTTEGPLTEIAGPRGPANEIGVAEAKQVQVCLDQGSASGSYTFDMSNVTQGDGTDAVPLDPNSLTVGVGPICFPALVRTADGNSAFGSVTVTASKDAPVAGSFSYTCVDDSGDGSFPLCINGTSGVNDARGGLNSFHGATITFLFTAEGHGCTYTLGWWKNKGKADAAAYDFDGGTNNGLDVLKMSPKGNPYYILAHQYITAALNVANGASMDGAALDAFNDATDYFAAASAGNPLPAPYTKNEVTALAATLDEYNNGIIGPGHCDD